MEVMEAIRKRKSVRSFLDRPVEQEKLDTVMEAARLAPSACNFQQWRFIVVRDAEMRKNLGEAASKQVFVGGAPAVIVACAERTDHVMACGLESHPIDVAIALDHMTLAAVEQGLGTCWIGSFDQQKVKDLLGIPESAVVVELMPLGYPADPSVKHKSRLSAGEIIMNERWEQK